MNPPGVVNYAIIRDEPPRYGPKNADLPMFGTMIHLRNRNIRHSTKQFTAIVKNRVDEFMDRYAADIQPDINPRTPKRKKRPYFRRTAFWKGIVMFDNWEHANEFVSTQFAEFRAFIPIIFVAVAGTVEICKVSNTESLKIITHHEILRKQEKLISENKSQILFFIRGTVLPETLNINDKDLVLKPLIRSPIRCSNCLRYGHRLSNCMRKSRCGICSKNTPFNWHRETACPVVQSGETVKQCLFCTQNHTIGSEHCNEHFQQCILKRNLVNQHMDFVNLLIHDVIPSIRATNVNSSFDYLSDNEKYVKT
ncbi:uncharacterized protein LOC129779603 [Toxorhynchites rutilus septentrionalis]|uniref:uncharacterized protein LOC129779603 n=1 Tax=Toxorhynchites rutilus septentrionalis TaxID=329112 RepID=UPI00247B04A0|nr:uncharacterized protein LOC129779603 [Toxorhynchites rutilus septentrionalis]